MVLSNNEVACRADHITAHHRASVRVSNAQIGTQGTR